VGCERGKLLRPTRELAIRRLSKAAAGLPRGHSDLCWCALCVSSKELKQGLHILAYEPFNSGVQRDSNTSWKLCALTAPLWWQWRLRQIPYNILLISQ
jgi:hypothetical protein